MIEHTGGYLEDTDYYFLNNFGQITPKNIPTQ